MTITPEQADRLKKNATDGPWMLNQQGCILVDDGTDAPPGPHGFIGTMWKNGHPDEEANGLLMAAAPDLAHTIAGMTWQHAVEVYNADAKCWIQSSNWISNRKVAEQDIDAYSRAYGGAPTRLVRRLVGPVEVTE